MSIEVRDLDFAYGKQAVLHGVSFSAADGELLSLLGPNGVGKSTLFRCILGLLRCYTGTITIDGRDARGFTARELARHIAYIPQSQTPSFAYSVFNMVLMGTTARLSALGNPAQRERDAAMDALERMGIAPLAEKSFLRISGGERQLVLLARALAQGSRVLVLDEPTANLDYGNQLRVMEQIRSLTREGYTVVQSTHNPEQAFLFSDRIAAMKDGGVLAAGAPRDVLTEELMAELYGADIRLCSLFDDKLRVCLPGSLFTQENQA